MVIKLRKAGINENDIGIITPYNRQVSLIKALLSRYYIDNITVGSVEEFQGGERKIIFISTVRTCYGSIASDAKRQLGFVKCAKRMNVAVSRAK